MAAAADARLCALRLAASGAAEACTHERCPFWEPGGAVVEAGCMIDRLACDVRRPDVAAYLLETRKRLEEARDAAPAASTAARAPAAERYG